MFTTIAKAFDPNWRPDFANAVSAQGDQGLAASDYDYTQAFSGIEGLTGARLQPDGTYKLYRAGSGPYNDFEATATVGPDGQVKIGDWSERNLTTDAQALGQFGLGTLALGAGLGAVGQGPMAGLFGAPAAPAAGSYIPANAAGALGGVGAPTSTAGFQLGQMAGSLAPGGAVGAGAVADPLAAYLATGGVEGSILGGGLTGAGGAAGAVGAGTAANFLGNAGQFLGGATKVLGGGSGGLLNLGGNLLNSYLGYKASGNAADAQIRASQEANALQKYMYDQSRADYAPWRETGTWALGRSRNLLENPSQISSDPSYQFELGEGMKAYDNSGAARGMRLSGAQAKALTRYGQDFAGTQLDRRLNRYNALSGSGLTATGATSQAGQNYANQAGQNITGAGNAAASGYIGGANAIAGGVNNFLRNWQEQNLLRQFGFGG